MNVRAKSALLVIDVQNDFCPSGYSICSVPKEAKVQLDKPNEKHSLYVTKSDNKLIYKVIDPQGVPQQGEITDQQLKAISSLPAKPSHEDLEKILPQIIKITAERKHTRPEGALAVKDGHKVVPIINKLMRYFPGYVVATKDWHPPEHVSFASRWLKYFGNKIFTKQNVPIKDKMQEQDLWPDHCVQNSEGSEFHPDLEAKLIEETVFKGQNLDVDSYSGFFDNDHKTTTKLDGYLRAKGVTRVYITGLATDYCVKATALHAKELGYGVYLVEDACRGVDNSLGDVATAIQQMKDKGVRVIQSSWVPLLQQIDESIDNLRAYEKNLWSQEGSIKAAVAAQNVLLYLLRDWNDVLRAPDQEKRWEDFKKARQTFIELAKNNIKSADSFRISNLFKPSQNPFLKELEHFEKLTNDLSSLAIKPAVAQRHVANPTS